MAKGPERVKKMVDELRRWQRIERLSVDQMADLMEATDNALVRQMAEIIRNDSVQHHRVQQFLIDTLTKEAPTLSPEEMATIWDKIEKHQKTEKDVVSIAKKLRSAAWLPVQKMILDYILTDEEKHDKLLDQLAEFKKGMYPYG
jgi:hypothetical protein